ncbi:nucleotidyltransferase domain-containing protein [Blautia sp. HCP3S3_G3]|uniref:nucleotidyltransferase domain-containing protein n=1 Tax=Blautia sp. HCP3S3_G3 TaxID=3438913 RepID=UPI003F8A6B9A
MSAEEVIDKVVEICKKHSVSQVILFGSRAKNTQMERSDIDIAVSGAGDFDSLCEEVEDIPTLYTIDLVELEECRNQLLLEDIRQYGRKIYEKI